MSESKAKLQQERDDLIASLKFVHARHETAQAEVDRLTQALLVPTDAMTDAARPIIAYLDGGKRTYGGLRDHVSNSGHSLEGWPMLAREKTGAEHIPKHVVAEIIWGVMAATALRP